MTEDPKELGALFKNRRRELNLSLKEAENATSIRLHHLQSIEEGEVAKLISPVYAQGFVRQYAAFLGIDGERIIREYPEIFSRQGLSEFSFGIGTLEIRDNQSGRIKWFPNLIWLVAIGGILALAWLLARWLQLI